jgi:uncharacterized protein (DUF58 family)
VPTPRGVTLLAGAAGLWTAGRLLGVYELYVAAAAAAVLVLAGVLWVRAGSASVSTRRSVSPQRLLFEAAGEVTLEVRNEARLPAALLLVDDARPAALAVQPGARPGNPVGSRGAGEVRFVVPGLARGATVALRYPVRGGARGRYTVGPLRVRVRDPFGTAERVRRYRSTDQLLVYPRVEPLGPGMPSGSHHGSGTSTSRRLFNTGDEFHTMREYVTGDDLRQVHWRSTARRSTLMVRQQEQPWQALATILVDTRAAAYGAAGGAGFELALSAAASLVWHLADRRYQLRLVTEADAVVPAVERWETLLDRLASASPSQVAGLVPIVRQLRGAGREGLLAGVLACPPGTTPVAGHPDVRALLTAGRGFSGRLALIVDSEQVRRRPTGARREPSRLTSQEPSGDGPSSRARELAGLLVAAGWKAAVVRPGRPLADSWQELLGRAVRRPAGAAFRPDRVAGA